MAGVGLLGGLIQFFVVLGLSQAYARAHAAELAKRVRFPWGGSRPLALVALAFVGLPLLGGALNRVRERAGDLFRRKNERNFSAVNKFSKFQRENFEKNFPFPSEITKEI